MPCLPGSLFDARHYAAIHTKRPNEGSAKDTKAACQESIRPMKLGRPIVDAATGEPLTPKKPKKSPGRTRFRLLGAVFLKNLSPSRASLTHGVFEFNNQGMRE